MGWLDPVTAGLSLSLFAAGVTILYLYGREGPSPLDALDRTVTEEKEISAIERMMLRLEIGKARATELRWFEKAGSAMGIIAFLGTGGALVIQVVQNAALEQQSEIDANQLAPLRAQSERAEKLLQPIVNSIIDDFEESGSRPNADQRELLQFAIDRWLTAPPSTDPAYVDNLKKAFRAALITKDFAAALAIADRLGQDFPKTNPSEQISLFEYAYTSGYGMAEKPRIQKLLLDKSRSAALPKEAQLRLFAIARNVGVLSEEQAVAKVAEIFRIDSTEAAVKLTRQGIRLADNRRRFSNARNQN